MSDSPTHSNTFGQPRPGLRTLRRRELRVRLARKYRDHPGRDERPAIEAAELASPAEAQRRFAICRTCEHSRDDAFACALHHACCFGRYRSNPANHCAAGGW